MINNLSYLPPVTIFASKLIFSYTMQKKSDNVKYNMRAANFDMMRETLSNVG